MRRADAKHACVPLRRARAGELRREEFLYELKTGQRAASGRPRPVTPPDSTAQPPNRVSTGEYAQCRLLNKWIGLGWARIPPQAAATVHPVCLSL